MSLIGNSRLRQRFANTGLATDPNTASDISLPSHGTDKLSQNHSKQSLDSTYPNIVPVNFGVKFSPPKLGLSYFVVGQTDQQSLIYEIMLKDFLTMDAETVTTKLFELHKQFLNPKYIKRMQVKRLVEKVLSVCGGKENSDLRNKKAEMPQANTTSKRIDGLQLEMERKPAKGQNVVLLEQAPDSERSMPSGIGSDFNDL